MDEQVKKPVAEQAPQPQAQAPVQQQAQPQPQQASPADITRQAATTSPVAQPSMAAQVNQQNVQQTNELTKLPIELTQPAPADSLAAQQGNLDAWRDNAQLQANAQIDYAVQQGTTELQRNLEDAQPQFETQQNQIAADERAALDNSALYAEMRGDRGGIGQAQYNSIQNQAAQSRLQVAQAQTKLSTDISRQISDLRAKGEFDKADAAFNIAQNYLSQLNSLQQWYASYAMSYDEFQASLYQWQKNYEMSMAQVTGKMPDGTLTWQAQRDVDNRSASAGAELLAAGVMPSEEQLRAMGMTVDQAQAEIAAAQMKDAEAKNASAGEVALTAGAMPTDEQLAAMGITKEQAQSYLDTKFNNVKAAAAGEALLNSGLVPSEAQLAAMGLTREQAEAYVQANSGAETKAAAAGKELLQSGIMPSEEQLKAMGLTQEQANSYIQANNGDDKKNAAAAEALLGAGVMPAESQLAAIGLTKEQAQAYIDSTAAAAGSSTLANAGKTLLAAGVMPNAEQLKAMGLTEDQARAYFAAMGFTTSGSGSGYGGGGGSDKSKTSNGNYTPDNPIPDTLWKTIGNTSGSEAAAYMNEYWDRLSTSQRNILARGAGLTPSQVSGLTGSGVDDYNAVLNATQPTTAGSGIYALTDADKDVLTTAKAYSLNGNPEIAMQYIAQNSTPENYNTLLGSAMNANPTLNAYVQQLQGIK